jgi:uncharacterized spore protein YtfJ
MMENERNDPTTGAADDVEGRDAWARAARVPAGERLLLELAERLGAGAAATRAFGEPIRHDDVTVIPVSSVRWGLGGGAGERPAGSPAAQRSAEERPGRGRSSRPRGLGAGGGVVVSPVGYILIRDGDAEFRPTGGAARLAVAAAVGALFGMLAARRRRPARRRLGRRASDR